MDRNDTNEAPVQQIWQQMRNDGVSLHKISEIYHVSVNKIRECTTGRTRETVSPELIEQVKELEGKGLTPQQIVDELKLDNVDYVYYILRKIHKRTIYDMNVPPCWVLNHPYQNELEPPERERYIEVVQNRRRKSPNTGYDYNNPEQRKDKGL